MKSSGYVLLAFAVVGIVSVGCGSDSDATTATKAPASKQPKDNKPTDVSGAAGAAAPSSSTNDSSSASAKPGSSPSTPNSPSTSNTNSQDAKPALDQCGLHTKWAGDQYCIDAPPSDKGFQIHIGPDDYENPDAKYVLEPGAETVENVPMVSGNDKDIYYYFRQYRMRPGSHHLIIYASSGAASSAGPAALGGGRRLGGSQNPVKDNPEGGMIAPENQGVGMPLAAKSSLTINLHYVNYTDKPLIKEAWVNFWYRDASDVKEPASEIFSFAPMNVAAGTHVLLHGSCPITQAGRILTLYGHRHANNKRFSIWHVRGDKKDLVYEDYEWEDPLVLEYSSLVKNVPNDAANSVAGGTSGILDLMPNDAMEFECDIVNQSTHAFHGANEALDDEMCILVGDSVETTVPARCTYNTTVL